MMAPKTKKVRGFACDQGGIVYIPSERSQKQSACHYRIVKEFIRIIVGMDPGVRRSSYYLLKALIFVKDVGKVRGANTGGVESRHLLFVSNQKLG